MSVLSSQHIALFFMFLGIYFLACQPIEKKISNYIIAGIVLAVSNIFRSEVVVINIAIICLFIWEIFNNNKHEIKLSVFRIISYFLIFMMIMQMLNMFLLGFGIVNNSILESNLAYKILVGTNFESCGTWNQEDSVMVMSNQQDVWNQIIDRINNPVKIAELIKKKVYITYGSYENFSCFQEWQEPWKIFFQENMLRNVCNAYMFIILLFTFYRCLKIRNDIDKKELFILICMLGYCAVYTIIETSNRYSYVIIPFFSIISAKGTFDFSNNYIEKDTLN